jgi:hypothetical protein
MKSSIKTCSVKSERTTGLTKLTICTAVILSLAFTANLSAVPTFVLDADTLAVGSYPASSPLVIATPPYGNITFVGEIRDVSSISPPDPEFIAEGAGGNAFDILNAGYTPAQTAELFFGFDVESIEFIYGGNTGSILIEARDKDGDVIDDFFQPNTLGFSAGPQTLSGSGIRSLYWTDTVAFTGFAALDKIGVTVGIIPSPGALVLGGIGVGFVGWLRKRKMV